MDTAWHYGANVKITGNCRVKLRLFCLSGLILEVSIVWLVRLRLMSILVGILNFRVNVFPLLPEKAKKRFEH